MSTVIEIENLTKKYRNIVALDRINLQVKEGEIYGLIGRNGAGKSSLLRILCGQSTQYLGSVKLFGTKIKENSHVRNKIGALIEYPAFYPELTGRQNLEYYRIQKGISQKESVEKVLHDMNIANLADRKFKQYSLGNKQRLGIALALLNNPEILILDEPTNGLDPVGIKEIRKFLLEINRNYNTTIIISSHILSELEHIITKVGFIDQGRMIKELSAEALKSKSKRATILKVTNHEKIFLLLKNKLQDCQVTLLDHDEIEVSGDMIDISEISRMILDANEKILSMRENVASLEDYYFNLIGSAANE
ncbi:ABC transporter ATP-binding protein [Paenibacillus faecalis]|uniref:ABC transporter ATP-binding protein n=1 Tax=Paenibacillus faecalis TaxID=2079532 RepID=UPI000D0E49BB|nr:ABC transporter ATP-binding protein [Paenibacillus faecalis]